MRERQRAEARRKDWIELDYLTAPVAENCDRKRDDGSLKSRGRAALSGMKSVCALVPYPLDTTPSQRFRIEQWASHLKTYGVVVEIFPFADQELMALLRERGRRATKALAVLARFPSRLRDVATVRRYDVVLIHRAVCLAGPAVLERLLTAFRKPVIFDFDDAVFLLHTTEANRRFGWLKFPGKTASICGLSTHVVAGNAYLADYARRYNAQVSIIPTSIDTARYKPPQMSGQGARVIVGWTGSSTSQTHLEMFAPILRKVIAQFNVELRVISDREPALDGIPYEWRRWSPDTEVEEIGCFDIGIMPMPDDQWSRGKCALKALQYMAMGVPALCSDIGANREVISQGENGFLAATPEQWLGSLGSLIESRDLRRKIGAAGRRTIEQWYSAQRCAGLFAGVVGQVTGQPLQSSPVSGGSIAAAL